MGEVRAIIGAALLAALSGCMHGSALPKGAKYVALGSSFAAGTAIGGVKSGTPVRCGRGEASYATLLAKRFALTLDDQSCGGATTAHVLGPWGELPPQINALNAETRLVSITIGGNDLGYVMNLFAASCRTDEGFTIQGRKLACPPLRAPTAEAYAALEAGLRNIAQQVRTRAPRARLVFVQYVRLVPDTPCPITQLSPEGALITRTIGERLAAITMRAAEAEGAEVLDADVLSRGHTVCDASAWSVGPKLEGEGAPWHPNRAGHAAIADALAQMLVGKAR